MYDPLTADTVTAIEHASTVESRAAATVDTSGLGYRTRLANVLTFIDNLPDGRPIDGDLRAAIRMIASPQPK